MVKSMDIKKHLAARLTQAKEAHPQAWDLGEHFRGSRGVDLPKWPAWCFLPISAWHAVVGMGQAVPVERMWEVSQLAALGAWRVSQGIYRFDASLSEALDDMVLKGEMPIDVFLRLPEWCVYIETPGLAWSGQPLVGFWVFLEWDVNTERRELRFLLDMADGRLVAQLLHLGPWTVTEGVDRMLSEAAKQSPSLDLPVQPDVAASDLQPLIARVLYLCSDEPDVIDREQPDAKPMRAKAKRVKKGWRLFAAKAPRLWNVGDELGQKLRSAEASDDADRDRKGPRPHLRRAHWHGYWTGPKEGERRFRYRFLAPTVVAGE